MKTWPQNVTRFKIDGIAVDELDQEMMGKFRRIADWADGTLADHLHQAAERSTENRDADEELETKIIIFRI
jgi:hypothetical protein